MSKLRAYLEALRQAGESPMAEPNATPAVPTLLPEPPVDARLVAVLADGPMPWDWLVYRVDAPYTETYTTVGTLLRRKRIRLLPNNRIELCQ